MRRLCKGHVSLLIGTLKLPPWRRVLMRGLLIVFVYLPLQFSYGQALDIPAIVTAGVPPPALEARSWVLMDHGSGWALASSNPDERIEPASLSKLLTAYVVFRELRKGTIQLATPVHISEKAWKTEGSRMFAKVNTEVAVEELLQGLIIQSGNDAAVALAEHVAGSESGFAEVMNATAAELGLNNSHFENSTGLPSPDHYSTARDISLLARSIIRDFPEYYRWYSQKEFTYNDITQKNRNLLLWRDESVDGVKTGHTQSAGYCLVGSALREDMRLIATVIGTKSKRYRAGAVHSLLKYGYAAYESKKLYSADASVVDVRVFKGELEQVPVGVGRDLSVTLPRGSFAGLQANVAVADNQVAPLRVGQTVGKLNLQYKGQALAEYPLIVLQDVAQGSLWRRVVDSVLLLFY